MNARDSQGRRVSLLNDEHDDRGTRDAYLSTAGYATQEHLSNHLVHGPPQSLVYRAADPLSKTVAVSSYYPAQPEYSYAIAETVVPDTQISYEDYGSDLPPYSEAQPRRPSNYSIARSSSFEDDTGAGTSSGKKSSSERSTKRFPCRYRDLHNCEKTFTTSGHASRHSKIHTAEKAVPCTHLGCPKKFTRADNMKQHLETHSKEKSRSSGRSSLSSGKSSSSSSRAAPAASGAPTPSPSDPWDMGSMGLPILRRGSSESQTDSSGLDALAMAIACQEGTKTK